MPHDSAWLETVARRLRARYDLSVAAAGLAAGSVSALAALRLGLRPGAAAAIGLAVALLTILPLLTRRRQLTSPAIAKHLDRTYPDLQESAELLLVEPDQLPPLSRLQRRRVLEALERHQGTFVLPAGPIRPLVRAAAGLALVTFGLILLPSVQATSPATDPAPGPRGHSPERGNEASLTLLSVTITPPAYTAQPARSGESWNLEVVEGALITWSLTTTGPVTGGRLSTAAGDTVALERRNGGYRAGLSGSRSTLYRIHLDLEGGGSFVSDDHRLLVRPDAPPLLTVVQPEGRTMVEPGASLRIPVEVLARDDYGVATAAIVATVSRGQGEGVRFREQRLEFTDRARRDRQGLHLRRELDLAALGLEPGDELYFHVVATDHRHPVPNEGRSETIFVTLVDSSRATTTGAGAVALDITPDYFRSQRQLIIDTEKLLGERRRLAHPVFMARSNGLGLDQGLLRLRYGQFMGDEFDGAMPASGREAHAHDDHDDHDEVTATPELRMPGTVTIPGQTGEDPLAELTHTHDDPENATLLAPQVKAYLREAITAMWSAELHLRLGDPEKSLPFQHQALELLQVIRQDARAYVQRVGFEPPPLEPDLKRLTGDLADIRAPTLDRAERWRDPSPILRDGLERLQRLSAGGPPQREDPARLEALGRLMAQRAVADAPWLLESLGALREGIRSLQARGPLCLDCLREAGRGVLRVLDPAPSPAASQRQARSGVVRRYFELLPSPR